MNSTSPNSSAVSVWVTVGPPETYQPIPDSVAPSYPTTASIPPSVYAPSGYEPVAYKLTYRPAKAAPANMNGDAATAAIVDLIILFLKYLADNKKPADGKSFDKDFYILRRVTIFRVLRYVMVFSLTQG